MFISCVFAISMGNVFNLCDIWNKPGWIYESVSSWGKLYHCEDQELELRWIRSEWNRPLMCCCQKRGGSLVSWQELKGWELASWGFKKQMTSQKQWSDVGAHKLHGNCFIPSARRAGSLQRLWHSGVCWAPRADCDPGYECEDWIWREGLRASK